MVDHQASGTNVTLKVESLDVLDVEARILDAGKSGFPDAKHGKWLEDVVFLGGLVGAPLVMMFIRRCLCI